MPLGVTPISSLPAATVLTDSDLGVFVQSGMTKKGLLSVLATYMATKIPLTSVLAVGNTTGSTGIIFSLANVNEVPYFDGSKKLVNSGILVTELAQLAGIDQSQTIQSQINGLQTGLKWKQSVKRAVGTNVNLLIPAANFDGVTTPAPGERYLLINQSAKEENGLYTIDIGGSAVRSSDGDTADKLEGMVVNIEEGTYADKGYTLTTDSITLGVTLLTYAGWGGTTYIGTSNRITVTGNIIDISSSYAGQSSITTLGTVTTGTLSTGAVIAGVTMTLGSDALGDVYYRGISGVLTRLAAGAAGTFLRFNGAGAAPVVSTLVMPNSATATRVPYATATNTWGDSANLTYSTGQLAIANGSLMVSGGSSELIFLAINGVVKGELGADSTNCLYVFNNAATVNFKVTQDGAIFIKPLSSAPSAVAGNIYTKTDDKYYGTITTGPAVKEFTMNNSALTSGTIPIATTNGRLTDSTPSTLVAGGIASIVASTFEKPETGTDSNVLTYGVGGGADEFLNVQVAVDVASFTGGFGSSVVVTITWKDSNNTTSTSILSLTGAGDGALNVPINAFAGSNVVVSTVFAGVSVAYNISSFIVRLK